MSIRRIVAVATVGIVTVSAPLWSQGTISTQGFGYPGGQLSTRALSLGGAVGEFDLQSPLNPAALAIGIRSAAWMQYDPEFRSSTIGTTKLTNTTARFPLFGVTGRFGDLTFGMAFASLLDRTWTNVYDDTITVGTTRVPSRATAQVSGGISDIRFAIGWGVSSKLSVGVGLHFLPGTNKALLGRDFADSLKIGSYTDANTVSYFGQALSLGVTATPVEKVNVAASLRLGGPMRARLGDSTIVGEGRVPLRLGLSVAYEGFAGAAIAVRWSRERWSDLRGLGSPGLVIHDATDLSAGLEFAGPKIAGIATAIRGGVRSRTLPFSPTADAVKESSLNGGVGLPFAQGRLAVDIGGSFATRKVSGLTETGTILSVAISIRP